MCATPLNPDTAWQQEPDNPLRSRYSGYPLKEGEMVISLLAWDSFTVGHSLIAFEWRHNPPNGTPFRCHRLFHLFPQRADEDQSSADTRTSAGLTRVSVMRVPGVIARGADRPNAEPVKALEEISAQSSDRQMDKMKVYYKSWAVPFDKGWAAIEQARKDQESPPGFNFVGAAGYNCAKWAQKIADVAGIDSRTLAAKIGFAIPIYENSDGRLVKSEKDMWLERKGG